ncbi:MAG: histidine utilization repressor [Burkholderiales bacterium]|nr:histidine utilization repressor [Burkholderiales bacterium]
MVYTNILHPPEDGVPPFVRVKHYLRQGLAQGRWLPGALMPSEADLVQQFGVSRMTVNRAIRELQTEGLVTRTQGLGTFAAALHRVSSTLRIQDVHEEIVERGHIHRSKVHVCREESAEQGIAEQLGVPVSSKVFHTLIVHYENGVPLQCEDRFVNPACAPNYLGEDFTNVTPTQHLFRNTALWRAQYQLEAAYPTQQEAKLLNIKTNDPCLIMVRRTHTRNAVITLARLVYPGSRYSLAGEFKP